MNTSLESKYPPIPPMLSDKPLTKEEKLAWEIMIESERQGRSMGWRVAYAAACTQINRKRSEARERARLRALRKGA